ncbi:MAG: OmpA family protein [Pseudonocardia sp.]|nr:OmpA family protein [Pseudonocardia sp.]
MARHTPTIPSASVRERRGRAGAWLVGAIAIPVVLAGLALVWPGPSIAGDLHDRAVAALDSAGLPGVSVEISGRDAVLARVPAAREAEAVQVVQGVEGVRQVRVRPGPAAGSPGTAEPLPAPTAAPPGGPAAPAVTPADRQRVTELLARSPLLFPGDSATLTPATARAAAQLGSLLAQIPAAPVELVGYTADSPGSTVDAQELSAQRAAVVGEALVSAGVDPARIRTRGAGTANPLSSQAASRRVELTLG